MTQENENKVTLRMVIKYFLKKSKPYKWLLLLSIFGSITVAVVGLISPIYQTKLVDIVAMT
jgi:ABC-type multidrug transport system fused ATPase/permease subunit